MKPHFINNEIELIKIVQDKHQPPAKRAMAKERLFEMNKNLVKSIALKFVNVDCELQDLIQEGYRGLSTAINKFDTKRNIKLSTYAYQWIFQSIQRNVGINSRTINIPQTLRDKYNYLQKIKQDFFEMCGYNPSISELASITGFKKEKVLKILHAGKGVISLDRVINNDEAKETDAASFIKDNTLPIDKQVIHNENINEFYKLLKSILTEREFKIICLKSGLNSPELTIQDIADIVGLSVPRIKQILKDIYSKIYRCEGFKNIWVSGI